MRKRSLCLLQTPLVSYFTYFADLTGVPDVGAVTDGPRVGGKTLTTVLARVAVDAHVHGAGADALQQDTTVSSPQDF